MDPKHIETVDNIVSGYNKVKTLYKENAEMIRKGKAWFKEHKTTIIIIAIVLGVVGYYVYKQYKEGQEEIESELKKSSVKEKPSVVLSQKADESKAEKENSNAND